MCYSAIFNAFPVLFSCIRLFSFTSFCCSIIHSVPITFRKFHNTNIAKRKRARQMKREREKQSQAHQLESISMHFNANRRQHIRYTNLLCVYKTPQRRANRKILSENNSRKSIPSSFGRLFSLCALLFICQIHFLDGLIWLTWINNSPSECRE